jgi:hypothetical protein
MSDSDRNAAVEKNFVSVEEDLYDPDAGLSEEEKKAMVSTTECIEKTALRLTQNRNANYSGSLTGHCCHG